MKKNQLRIGIMGTRGIPNRYGGFEQLAQCLSEGLTKKGHEVFVYTPHNHIYKEKNWNKVNIIHCYDPEYKIGTAGQFIYDRNSINDARKRNFDVLLHLGYTSDSIWYRRWPKNTINIVNMDGLEWKRSKYSFLTKKFLKWAESLAARHADVLIADSPGIQQHLLNRYNKSSVYIPYGANLFTNADETILKKYHLLPYCYSLLIARLEPENNIEMIIQGCLASDQKDPLLIMGPSVTKYAKRLVKKYKNSNVIFAGSIYDENKLNNLRFFSSFYFHGHSSGGTNPSLLEAMACGCTIAAHDNIFNRAVLETNADYFSSTEDITAIINFLNDPDIILRRKEANLKKVKTKYSWEGIIEEYEKLFLEAIK